MYIFAQIKLFLQKMELAHQYWIIKSWDSVELNFQAVSYPMLSILQQEN